MRHLVEVDLVRDAVARWHVLHRVVRAVVQDVGSTPEPGLVAGVEHHVTSDVVRHAHLRGGEDVAVHLRVPHGLLLAHRAHRLVRRLERRHRLSEEDLGLAVGKGAHPLGVLEPPRCDEAKVLTVKDVEAADLRKLRHELLGDEPLGEPRACPDEVRVLRRDDYAACSAERNRIDRIAEDHVGVHHEDELIGVALFGAHAIERARALEPRHHRVRLVVGRIADLIHERVVPQVAVHEGGADALHLRRIVLLLLLRACEQPRDVGRLGEPRGLEGVVERDAVPVEERVALGREDYLEGVRELRDV